MFDHPGFAQAAARARCLHKRAHLIRDLEQSVAWHLEADDIETRLGALHDAAMTISLEVLDRVAVGLADSVRFAKPHSQNFLGPSPHAGPVSEACHQ